MGKILAWGAGLSVALVVLAIPFRNDALALLGAMLFWLFVFIAIGRKFFRWLAR